MTSSWWSGLTALTASWHCATLLGYSLPDRLCLTWLLVTNTTILSLLNGTSSSFWSLPHHIPTSTHIHTLDDEPRS